MAAKKRWLNDAQCKQAAARISGEMKDYAEHLATWQRGNVEKCTASVVPIWGPDLEAVKMKVERLYHPAEAEIIIAALTA